MDNYDEICGCSFQTKSCLWENDVPNIKKSVGEGMYGKPWTFFLQSTSYSYMNLTLFEWLASLFEKRFYFRMSLPFFILTTYLFMPLQQHSAAVVGGLLKASVDVFHQQVHSSFVQWGHSLLYVTALKAAENSHHQQLCSLLNTHTGRTLDITQHAADDGGFHSC